MQLMADAITVLGSRHGLLWDPVHRRCSIIRFDRFTRQQAVEIHAGAIIDGQEYRLPLCADGETFNFHDQRTSPCSMSLIGIHAASNIKVTLTVATPFRPRDAAFSTTPVLALRLTAEQLPGIFRWEQKTVNAAEVELFLEITGPGLTVEPHGDDAVDLRFTSIRNALRPEANDAWDFDEQPQPQHDRLVVTEGTRQGTRFTRRVTLAQGAASLDLQWCTYSEPILEVRGERYPFKYAEQFADLEAVAAWARRQPHAVLDNACQVDRLVGDNDLSLSTNHLLAYTLHSWLADTWWGARDGQDHFAVWEGSCYMLSTVDVEYTQAPFYLTMWPELLGIELDYWPHYSVDGTQTLGERGAGTRYLSHDSGSGTTANRGIYSHPMEVEENCNYIILSLAYWKRTGDDRLIRKHADTLEQYLQFLALCDTTGDGVPDIGVANTIDDASPAIQFGREQVYLGTKALAAFAAGDAIMTHLGREASAQQYRERASRIRTTIEEKGWLGDHFATLLEKRGVLKNPWNGEEIICEEIPGWDAAHIYSMNGQAVLDLVDFSLGLNEEMVATDLRTATARCLREYGCVHSDFENANMQQLDAMLGLVGVAKSPGWISMNMLRDIAAFTRGIDLRALADRYWEWQVTTNTQEPKLFFETFNGNNLCFYPRGVAVWGYLQAARQLRRIAMRGCAASSAHGAYQVVSDR